VTALVGWWGSGKTLELVRMCEEKRLDGYEIATNFGYVHGQHVSKPEEVIEFMAEHIPEDDEGDTEPEMLVFLAVDEAGCVWPSRGWSRWPPEMDLLVQQGRKIGCEIAYTTPDIAFVDANIRRITTDVVKCKGRFNHRVSARGVRPVRRRPRLFTYTHYEGVPGARTEHEKRVWRLWRSCAKYSGLYNTYHLIAAARAGLLAAAAKLRGEGLTGAEWGTAEQAQVQQVQQIETAKRPHRVRLSTR
jgi:hypothetical protein